MITSKRRHHARGLEPRSSSRTLRPSSLLLLLAVPLPAFSMTAFAQHKHPISEEDLVDGAPAVADEVIVKFRPNAGRHAIAEIEVDEDIDATESIGDGRAVLFHSRSRTTAALLHNRSRRPDVEYVEPPFFVQAALAPNDPHRMTVTGGRLNANRAREIR